MEGLVCTVTPFQVVLKYFKRSQPFVDPGASFDGFDDKLNGSRGGMLTNGPSELRNTEALETAEFQFLPSFLANSRVEEKGGWRVNEAFLSVVNHALINCIENKLEYCG